jgi:hypothetical protein
MRPRREVVQVLLALTIISTVAGVICALDALGVLRRHCTKSQTVVIVVNEIETFAIERRCAALGSRATMPAGAAPCQRGRRRRRVARAHLVRS